METIKVAKILEYKESIRTKIKDEEVQVVFDANGYIIVNAEDAEELFDSGEFQIVDYNPSYIGAPRPRRPRN